MTPSPEQPEHEEARDWPKGGLPHGEHPHDYGYGEHEEARRLAGKLLTGNERELARASWANGVVADPNIPKWGNLVLEAYDAAAALLSKAEQERDEWHRNNLRMARELERLREAICAEAHHFPPDAVAGTSCYCGKAAW